MRLFTGALMISSGFTLNLTVCAMFIKKPSQGINEIPIELTQQQRKKSLKSWSGYYFQDEEYCIDEDADKREFFWNIKTLVSIHECPVAFEDYKMPINYINTSDTSTNNNVMKKSSIKDGVIMKVEGLSNEAYESSTDNLENRLNNETCEISTDNLEKGINNEAYESSTDNLETVQETNIDTLPTANNAPNAVNYNRKFSQNIITYTSTTGRRYTLQKQSSMNRRPSILDKKGRESIKAKYKLLYTNVYFILLLINLVAFHLGISVVYTHLLPFAESQLTSSSIGLLMVSLLAGAGLIGKIALGAVAQSPRVNAIVLYIVAVILCGKKHWQGPKENMICSN